MNISILGCGWLGLPLGKQLADRGYHVKGSTRTASKLPALDDAGIEPFQIDLNPEPDGSSIKDFLNSDVLVIDIPPGTHRNPGSDVHVRQISALITRIPQNRTHVIYISSTSVYPNMNRIVTEEDTEPVDRKNGHILLQTEDLLINEISFNTTIIRFAGLYGYDRHPGRFMSGRSGLKGSHSPVNMIHRDDGIGIISLIIEKNITNEILNGCSDEHPEKREYYTNMASRLGLPPPSFNHDYAVVPYKIISNEKLKRMTGYRFLYPSPYDGPLEGR